MPYIAQLKSSKVSDNLDDTVSKPETPTPHESLSEFPGKSRRLRKDSLENLDADPWASPAVHKGLTHDVRNEATPQNSVTAVKIIPNGLTESTRTTSNFTTRSGGPNPSGSGTVQNGHGTTTPGDESSGAWGSYGASESGLAGSGNGGLGGEGYGGSGQGQQPGGIPTRSIGGGRTRGGGAQETVTITVLPEKEGMFMFQHRNYEVKSLRQGSVVVRRYSDFVWLLNCLHKRYPFRQLPLLPPKTLGGESF